MFRKQKIIDDTGSWHLATHRLLVGSAVQMWKAVGLILKDKITICSRNRWQDPCLSHRGEQWSCRMASVAGLTGTIVSAASD